MPEGLSPAEAHKELQHHEHAPRLAGRHGRILQICEAAVLAVVTLTAAWSGFAAAKWGTESRLELAAASTARTEANRAVSSAEQTRSYDASMFNAWFTAWTLDRVDKMKIAERRFRPGYEVAFQAWRRTAPETNPNAPPGPSYMPEYVVPAEARAAGLDKQGERARGRRSIRGSRRRPVHPGHCGARGCAVPHRHRQHVHDRWSSVHPARGRRCPARCSDRADHVPAFATGVASLVKAVYRSTFSVGAPAAPRPVRLAESLLVPKNRAVPSMSGKRRCGGENTGLDSNKSRPGTRCRSRKAR